ncbi:DUF5064 family protein [Pseudomonas sp. TCU-HL1]|uniref:DUF5064 family protein n=1 Tax=Pseudomonas sp. TCU-HL1 TaxID=1856685 RepID=UPI00083E168C|nr:DUF5064 family protein [Pseudomonas sp. TCU-HL1]AOE87992.1 hypothetical protein THL1_5445 [Pseudomonas sp. TCU-HL1]
MFKPGKIAIKQSPIGRSSGYERALDYETENREQGQLVNFELNGQIGGEPVHERFSLHRDVAYNFLQSAGLRLRRYGFRSGLARMPELRADFERVYADLRQRLGVEPDHPVDLERFLHERP